MMAMTFFQTKEIDTTIPRVAFCAETQSRELFKVIAHGFLELLRQQKVDVSSKKINAFLEQHAKYFPKQLPVLTTNMSNAEKLNYLQTYNQPSCEVLEPTISFTLTQMVVDVMCEKPAIYGHLFLMNRTPKDLRQAKNLDEACAIKALAKEVLGINILIERYNKQYSLPTREYFFAEKENSPDLLILSKENYYQTTSNFMLDDAEVA